MADIANKYAENVSGKFYVDDQCIDCDLCRETAPVNFTRSDDGGYSYVFKQPTTPEEEALCKEAMEGCPVEAIGQLLDEQAGQEYSDSPQYLEDDPHDQDGANWWKE
jgi:ferredoxin